MTSFLISTISFRVMWRSRRSPLWLRRRANVYVYDRTNVNPDVEIVTVTSAVKSI